VVVGDVDDADVDTVGVDGVGVGVGVDGVCTVTVFVPPPHDATAKAATTSGTPLRNLFNNRPPPLLAQGRKVYGAGLR
jgi:hypothetical protein